MTADLTAPPTVDTGTVEAAPTGSAAERLLDLEDRHGAHNYHPLPVVIATAEGAWVHDADGRRYLDALAAYSAVNFGHGHPGLIAAAKAQLDRVTLTSRAFHNDQLGPFCAELAELCGMDRVLPMNTGAEAVETGIKTARKWGYEVKGVPDGQAEIIVMEGNFHGRTTTIVSFSDDPVAHDHFGPYTPGFVRVPYGSAQAIRDAITPNTVAVLLEPVQGEAGVVVPPAGYLQAVRDVCDEQRVLMIADEIQAGLGRTGKTFACEHEGVVPDLYLLGKALGGGIVPLSAVVGSDEVLGVFGPGQHGSTFGGNPLACAVGREVIALLRTGEFQQRAAELGQRMADRLAAADLPRVKEIRAHGLWLGVEMVDAELSARQLCEQLLERGLLAKDTHETTIRLAPPLVITPEEADWIVDQLIAVL
ncbi:ornithine--oxo-acid transaminase [Euzebya rosea]|uniref:ornithine--oxo-acid transaminase n=1 Tax=Euzebya rosea TaxID=2052804 RepID=UPI000D3E138A|nr:ornithine--oxo-acid transaminase [Euzebya rosea]